MPRVVALDLGTAAVKATVWNVAGRRATFVERLMEPVPQPATSKADLSAQLTAVAALVSANPTLTTGGNVIAASFGGRHLSVHEVVVPFTDPRQVATTLPGAIEEKVPFDLDDMLLAWRVVDKKEGTRTLVTLVEQDALRQTIEGLSARKLEPRQIAADKELLARWATASDPAMPDTASPLVAVIDLGHSHTGVCVFRDGILLGSRDIDLGGSDVTRAIQRSLGCSLANAERLKIGQPPEPDADPGALSPTEAAPVPDAPDEDDTQPGKALDLGPTPWDALPEPGLANLPEPTRAAVQRTLDRWMAEVRSTLIGFEDVIGAEVAEIRIGGGGARLDGLITWMQEDLGVSIRWAAPDDSEPIPPEYLLADTLAEHLAGNIKVPYVDLRTGPLRWRSGFDLMQATVTYGGALVILVTAALLGIYVYQIWDLSNRVTEVDARLLEVAKSVDPEAKTVRSTQIMKALQDRLADAEARAKVLGSAGPPPTTDLVHALSTSLPGPNDLIIDVTSLTASDRALSFEAEVATYAAADQVEVALQSVDRFKTCTKSNEQQRRGKISFNVNCDLSGEAAEDKEDG
jgi:Tfp pilus assembly PilM family ATPase